MKRVLTSILVFTLTLVFAGPSSAGPDLNVSWSNGLRIADDEGQVKIKLGGRLMSDWVFQRGDDELEAVVGPLQDGTEFRRLRFYFAGTIYKMTEFKLQLDFAGGSVGTRDVYLGLKRVPLLGTVRIGHQFEPMGLSEVTSSKYITFIERATPMAFAGSRKTGVLATRTAGPAMWAVMISRNSDGTGESVESGQYNYTGRLAVVAVEEDGGKRLLHLGVSGSRRNPSGNEVSFSARPENHLAPRFVAVEVEGDAETVLGAEAAAVLGSFSVQGEYLMSSVNALEGPDPSFAGWYAFASWFVTGEHRPYSRSAGSFQRVKPIANYDGEGGRGALELGARISQVNLNDGDYTGGKLQNLTFGANWYLNPVVRIMANYVRADLDGVGVSHSLVSRAQIDF